MSPWLSSALADARGREMRGEPARPLTGPPAAGAPAACAAVRRPRVRHRVGFALVEAGLHLLATAPRG